MCHKPKGSLTLAKMARIISNSPLNIILRDTPMPWTNLHKNKPAKTSDPILLKEFPSKRKSPSRMLPKGMHTRSLCCGPYAEGLPAIRGEGVPPRLAVRFAAAMKAHLRILPMRIKKVDMPSERTFFSFLISPRRFHIPERRSTFLRTKAVLLCRLASFSLTP